ncbi:hypothetical protein Daus18300_000575 [Diaporthe australafricana]|uniref:F-box domain-containing protein n=1 Tax=Diaporthe australafricana TaxID=127596 RepID=A0ABR3Y503_9PEZI
MESTDASADAEVPFEIRAQILKDLLQLCREEKSSAAPYASVSKAWQETIEPEHFASISLTAARVNEFGRAVIGSRRRKLVNHIKLEVNYRPTNPWDEGVGRSSTTNDMLSCRHDFVYTLRILLLWLRIDPRVVGPMA